MQPDLTPSVNTLIGHSIPNNPPIDPVKEKTIGKKILKGLGKFADAIHRTGIVLTGALPFSSRGIILNLALAPFLIPIRIVQSLCSKSKFTDKMDKYMDRDWNAGIQDFYIDLESPKIKDLRKKVLEENFRYAAYMYAGLNGSSSIVKDGGKEGVLLSSRHGNAGFPKKEMKHLTDLEGKLKKIGFKVDIEGNYYNTETGNMFNLVYDKERNEIIICFMGLGNQRFLEITEEEEKNDLGSASGAAAGIDWVGGVPAATLEAIKIGKILKKTAEAARLTAVLVGHSHGAGMAQAGAVANGIKGIAFNSRPMGAGVRRYIGQSKIANNAKHITTFSGRGDWLSGTVVVNVLAVIFERLTGIPVPRSIGTGYHLPDIPLPDIPLPYIGYKIPDPNHSGFYTAFNKLKNILDVVDDKPKVVSNISNVVDDIPDVVDD